MRSEADQLADLPDFIALPAMLKARPSAEGDRRFIFLEASNEGVDHQQEITLQKALEESADYYLRHGNVDIGHHTIIGPRNGVPNYLDYEIGRPVDVKVAGKQTFVKAELFRKEPGKPASPQVVNADMVWHSMTSQQPPMRWYPSVGGAVLKKSMRFDPESRSNVAVIEKVRWNNIALDRCPVNKTVGEASAVPLGVFAKSMGGALVLAKSDGGAPAGPIGPGPLTAGYGTDAATFTGGRALSTQSLDGVVKASYLRFRDGLAKAIASGAAEPSHSGLRDYAIHHMGVDERKAAGLVTRFLQDLRSSMKRKSA
jgi:hypothetical protein